MVVIIPENVIACQRTDRGQWAVAGRSSSALLKTYHSTYCVEYSFKLLPHVWAPSIAIMSFTKQHEKKGSYFLEPSIAFWRSVKKLILLCYCLDSIVSVFLSFRWPHSRQTFGFVTLWYVLLFTLLFTFFYLRIICIHTSVEALLAMATLS